MDGNNSSNDKSWKSLEFIINVLKEHERALNNSIEKLTTVAEKAGGATSGLYSKLRKVDEKMSLLQKEVTDLTGYVQKENKRPQQAPQKESAS